MTTEQKTWPGSGAKYDTVESLSEGIYQAATRSMPWVQQKGTTPTVTHPDYDYLDEVPSQDLIDALAGASAAWVDDGNLDLFTRRETFQSVFRAIFDEAFDTLVQKQRSYGARNVEELGFYGVFSRLASDKVERLRNGLSGKVVNGKVELDFNETLDDETLEDTLVDILNYAAILICLKRGLWGKPLA